MHASAGAKGACGILFRKRNQSGLAFFAVIADIDRYAPIALMAFIFDHSRKVLNGVERFAAAADDNAVILAAVKFKENLVLCFVRLNFAVCKSQAFDNGDNVPRGFFVRVGRFKIGFFRRLRFGGFVRFRLIFFFRGGFLRFRGRLLLLFRLFFFGGCVGHLYRHLHFGGRTAEQPQNLFRRHLYHFIVKIVVLGKPELEHSRGFGFLNGGSGLNYFFRH